MTETFSRGSLDMDCSDLKKNNNNKMGFLYTDLLFLCLYLLFILSTFCFVYLTNFVKTGNSLKEEHKVENTARERTG